MAGSRRSRQGAASTFNNLKLSNVREAGSWVAGGDRVLFSAALGGGTNLWEIPLSAEVGRVGGPPRRLTTGPGPELHPFAAGGGRVVFSNLVENRDVWSVPADAVR